MGIEVLGPLSVDGGADLGPRDRVVLAALALHRGELVAADRLADALWQDRPPASWSKVVQGCVVRLRKALGAGAIETTPHGYRLAIPVGELDAHRFEQLLGRGRELLALGEPERAAHVLQDALRLWRGTAFAELDGWEPGRIEAARLDELRRETEEAHLDAALRAGRHREVLADAQARVAEAPLRELRWCLLALAQYRTGRQADALRTLNRARAVLAEELGLDPGRELVALEQAILNQDPSLAPATAAPEPSATCPYLGLVPYDVDDADGFFGRDAEVAACLRTLAATGVLTVMGPSGSGKSSLVRAGVAAALRRDGRHVVVVTPGARPMEALTALPGSGPPPTLVVDQAEEAVALCDDAAERSQFFSALAAHAGRAPLVIALRADRLGDLSAHPVFARLVERNVHLLSAMAEDDLRAAIEGPARQAGLLLEPGLVDLLARDVEGEPGALPLLSHALRQTWARREGRTLTVAGYRETGGIRGAVAQSAEAVYEGVAPEERPVLRDMLLRLVTPSPQGEPVRARVPRRVVAGDAAHDRLVEVLVAARLVTSDDGVVELAHEALARAWPRLRGWLDEDVEGQRILRHLTVAAESWDAMGRPESELYRGARLAQALDWRERVAPGLTPAETEFLDASRDRAETDLREAQDQVRREHRTVRRLRALVAGVAALALVAAVTSALAFDQGERADDQAQVAEARRAGAQALVERPYDRALLLALEGVRLWDSPETRGNLVATIERSPRAAGVIRNDRARLLDLEVSPGGDRLAVVDNFDDLTLYDPSTRSEVARLAAEGTSYRTPHFSPDGERLAVSRFSTECLFSPSCPEFGVDLLDGRDLRPVGVTFEGLGVPAADVAFSPGGDLVAAVAPLPFFGPVDNIAIWRVDQPAAPVARLSLSELVDPTEATPDRVPGGWARFSPDGTRLYASGGGPTVAFDVATGQAVRSYDGRGALALSPDGGTIAVATASTRVGLFDTATGAPRAELVGHDAIVTRAAFSPDGSLVATVSNDETAAVWDAATGERLHVLEGHAGSVLGVGFAADAAELYTSGADRALMLWDLEGRGGLAREILGPVLTDQPVGFVALSPAGRRIALIGSEVHLVDLRGGARGPTRLGGIGSGADISWAAFRSDGRRLVTVRHDGELQLWDAETAELLAGRPGRGEENHGAVAFTPDGERVVVADADGTVTELAGDDLKPTGRTVDVGMPSEGVRATVGDVVAVTASPFDVSEGAEVVFATLRDGRVLHRLRVASWGPRANFSPDGLLYAVGGFDGRLGVIDVATGELVGPRDPVHEGPIAWVEFSPDNRTLVSMGFDGTLALSDATTAVPHALVQPGRPNLRSAVGFGDDGHTVLIAYEDGAVVAYETDPAAWADHACAVAGRNLTLDEWRDAFGDRAHRQTCPRRS